jgi:hypothetical protein
LWATLQQSFNGDTGSASKRENGSAWAAELGAVKVGVSVAPEKVAQFFSALSTNVAVVVGAVIQQMLPGAGTSNVGQTGPPSSPSQAVVNLSGGGSLP